MRKVVLTLGGLAIVAACNSVLGIPTAAPDEPEAGASSSSSGGTKTCASNKKACGSSCVALNDPSHGCGGTSCDPCSIPGAEATCDSQNACAFAACSPGFKDCNAKTSDGCEVNITNDLSNCGDCGNPCEGALTCEAGVCGCDQGFQCGINNAGDDGTITCQEGRICNCFNSVCNPGVVCDIQTGQCNAD